MTGIHARNSILYALLQAHPLPVHLVPPQGWMRPGAVAHGLHKLADHSGARKSTSWTREASSSQVMLN